MCFILLSFLMNELQIGNKKLLNIKKKLHLKNIFSIKYNVQKNVLHIEIQKTNFESNHHTTTYILF